MNTSASRNDIVVKGPDLDIYAAMELKNMLDAILEKGTSDVALNLEQVSSLSTPAVQVIISALKSFERFSIVKDSLQPSLLQEFRSIGIDI